MISNVKKELKLLFIEGDFLIISLSVYLGFVMQQFLQSVVKNIFYPILRSFLPENNFKQFKINNQIVDLGDIIKNLINLTLALIICYIIIRIILRYLD